MSTAVRILDPFVPVVGKVSLTDSRSSIETLNAPNPQLYEIYLLTNTSSSDSLQVAQFGKCGSQARDLKVVAELVRDIRCFP